MSVIAVKGVPFKWNLMAVVKTLAKVINGQFEALNFAKGVKKHAKTCYLRLSERLDPLHVVERINSASFKKANLTAFIPKHVPDLPLPSKTKKIPHKMCRALKISSEYGPEQVLERSHNEVMKEMQFKFTGLHNLSRKTGHKLLANVAKTVSERLKQIINMNADASESSFKLTQFYRKTHPHFGDFQLLLSSLHALQDAAGAPRSQLQEHELTEISVQPYAIDNIPYDQVQQASHKYSDMVIKKVVEHIRNLDTDTEADVARKRVREEFKKISPHIPQILKQIISISLTPVKTPHHRMRIYGEPFLPSKDTMAPFLKRYHALKVVRSEYMYNMMQLTIPQVQYSALIAMDGTVVGGAKLVIRSSDMPLYDMRDSLMAEEKGFFGAEHEEKEMTEYKDDDEGIDWTMDL